MLDIEVRQLVFWCWAFEFELVVRPIGHDQVATVLVWLCGTE
jgi:hypothetical protein